jgi:predicted MFS family arabinose efflux permease
MTAIALGLIAFGGRFDVTTALLGLWGLVATSAPVGWWTWLSRTLPHDAEAGGGLMVAVVQIAITSGAGLGGVLYDTSGYMATFAASSAICLVAAGLSALTGRLDGRRGF